MNCPYCAEEIKDEALVCRFCKRDLSFYLFSARLSALEITVQELQQNVAGSAKTILPASEPVSAADGKSRLMLAIGVVCTAVLYSVALWGSRRFGFHWMLLIRFYGSALPFAAYLLIKTRYKRLLQYFLTGLWVAIARIMAWTTITALTFPTLVSTAAVLKGFGNFVAIDSLLFLTVGLFHIYMDRPKDGRNSTIFSSRALSKNPGDQWKRVSEVTAALAPFLTLIGSIVAEYLSYLATVARAATK